MPEVPKIVEPYHPVVQLRFGRKPFIITIPPDYLVEFTATEVRGGKDQATLVFIDPTFVKIESFLLQLDKETAESRSSKDVPTDVLFYRWGFPGLGLEERPWRQGAIATYTPTLSTAGMRISLDIWARGTTFQFITEPKTYKGKISSVVTQMALEMGYPKANVFVEETDDDEMEEDPRAEWSVKNQSRVDFMESLKQSAKSKTNPSKPYFFKLSLDGTFHFHTIDFSRTKKRKRTEPRIFKVLFAGPNTGVTSFTPAYNSRRIGNFAQTVLATTYDPRTKQYQKRVLTRKTLGLQTKDDPKNARTTSGPLVKSDDREELEKVVNAATFKPSQQVALGGRCSGKTKQIYASPQRAFAYLEHSFKVLHETVSGAQLELVGLPEFSDFTPDEHYCDVHVVLPPQAYQDAVQTGSWPELSQGANVRSGVSRDAQLDVTAGLHWSSGRYQVKRVTHTITSGYTISAELGKPTMLVGPDEARTGPPAKAKPATVKTT